MRHDARALDPSSCRSELSDQWGLVVLSGQSWPLPREVAETRPVAGAWARVNAGPSTLPRPAGPHWDPAGEADMATASTCISNGH